MANLGVTPLSVTGNVVSCARCGKHLSGAAAGAVVRARYLGPELSAVLVTDGPDESAKTLHRCDIDGGEAE